MVVIDTSTVDVENLVTVKVVVVCTSGGTSVLVSVAETRVVIVDGGGVGPVTVAVVLAVKDLVTVVITFTIPPQSTEVGYKAGENVGRPSGPAVHVTL